MGIRSEANGIDARLFDHGRQLFSVELQLGVGHHEVPNVLVWIPDAAVFWGCYADKEFLDRDICSSSAKALEHFTTHSPVLEESEVVDTEPCNDGKCTEQGQPLAKKVTGGQHFPHADDGEGSADQHGNQVPHDLSERGPNLLTEIGPRMDRLLLQGLQDTQAVESAEI